MFWRGRRLRRRGRLRRGHDCVPDTCALVWSRCLLYDKQGLRALCFFLLAAWDPRPLVDCLPYRPPKGISLPTCHSSLSTDLDSCKISARCRDHFATYHQTGSRIKSQEPPQCKSTYLIATNGRIIMPSEKYPSASPQAPISINCHPYDKYTIPLPHHNLSCHHPYPHPSLLPPNPLFRRNPNFSKTPLFSFTFPFPPIAPPVPAAAPAALPPFMLMFPKTSPPYPPP